MKSGRSVRAGWIAALAPIAVMTLLCVLMSQRAMAQSTIFNIPSTDTVGKGQGYVEFDFLPQVPGPDQGAALFIFNPRVIVGLPHDVEVGLNVPIYHNSDGSPSTLAYIQPNIKWKFYKNDDEGVASSAGVVVNTPLNSRDGQATWSYVYGNFSKKVKTGDYGPRFTAGPYGVIANADPASGPVSFIGPSGGVLLGYEQPLSKTVSFVADWFSGKNSMGYFTPGISVTLPHSGLLNAGYSVGNDSWANSNATKNRFLFVYYGVTF